MVSKGDGLGRYTQAPQLQGIARVAAGNSQGSCRQDRLLGHAAGGSGDNYSAFQSVQKTGDGDKHTHLGSWLPLLTLVTLRRKRRGRSAPDRYRPPPAVHAYI